MPRDFLDPYSRGNTICHRLPDRLKILLVLAMIITALVVPARHWPVHGLMGAALFLMLSLAGIPLRYIVVRLMFFFPMILGLAIAVPVSTGFTKGWDIMATILLRSTLSFLGVLWLVNVTPFDRLLVAMRKMGLPQTLAAILSFMYRYIFVVFDELERMREARRARTFSKRGTWASWKSNAQLIGMLLIRSMDRAERVHGAMCARGFDGEIRTLK